MVGLVPGKARRGSKRVVSNVHDALARDCALGHEFACQSLHDGHMPGLLFGVLTTTIQRTGRQGLIPSRRFGRMEGDFRQSKNSKTMLL
jgi:hypothetical protein